MTAKKKTPAKPLAERIADRLFDSSIPSRKIARLAQMIETPSGELIWGGWCKESVVKIIDEELKEDSKRAK